MEIYRIWTKSPISKKKKEKNDNETLIDLRRENEQLRKRVEELEKWLEEAIATLTTIL